MKFGVLVSGMLALSAPYAQALEFSCTVGKDDQPPFVFFIKDVDLAEGTAQFAVSGTKAFEASVKSSPNVFTVDAFETDDKSAASYLITIMLGPTQPYKVLSTLHFATHVAEDNKAVGQGATLEGLCTKT